MKLLITIISCIICAFTFAQAEKQQLKNFSSTNTINDSASSVKKDSATHITFVPHDPRKATRRSLIIPGWGQAYNKQYWKIPLVYGILAIPTVTFIYNNNWFKKTSYAYDALYLATYGSNPPSPPSAADSIPLQSVDGEILPGIKAGRIDLASLQNARTAYRRDRDYSAFWFLILWGINVVDATVSGHLKDFNVSKDLAMHVEPKYNSTYNMPGVGLTFTFRNQPKKIKEITR
jgi:hypothetical protein